MRRLEKPVSETDLGWWPADDCECLVLRIEDRSKTCRALRCAESQLVDARNMDILGDSPRSRIAIVVLASCGGPEQRRLISADKPVDDVCILEVERRDQERPASADRLGERVRGQAAVVHRGELRRLGDRKLSCGQAEVGKKLILVRVTGASGIRERPEFLDAREIRAGVVAPTPVVLLIEAAVSWITCCVEESEGRERLV